METAESARIKQDYQGRCVSGTNTSSNKSILVLVFVCIICNPIYNTKKTIVFQFQYCFCIISDPMYNSKSKSNI